MRMSAENLIQALPSGRSRRSSRQRRWAVVSHEDDELKQTTDEEADKDPQLASCPSASHRRGCSREKPSRGSSCSTARSNFRAARDVDGQCRFSDLVGLLVPYALTQNIRVQPVTGPGPAVHTRAAADAADQRLTVLMSA